MMHKAQHLLGSVSHMRMSDDAAHLLSKTVSLDDGTHACEGSTLALFIDSDVRVLQHQHQQFIDDEESSEHNLSCWWPNL
jgi:hypothetical protein